MDPDWGEYWIAALIGLPDTNIDELLFGAIHALPAPPAPPSDPQEPSSQEPPVPPSSPSLDNSRPSLDNSRPSLDCNSRPAKRTCPSPLAPLQMRRRQFGYRTLKLRSGATFRFDDTEPAILLRPHQEPNLYIRKLLALLPRRVKDRLTFLATFSDDADNEVTAADWEETDEIIHVTPEQLDPLRHVFHHLREQLYTAYLLEMRMRRAFRTLLHRWRIRRVQREDPIDPITLSPPTEPVTVYDLPRRIYHYEARSLSTWCEANLAHHEGGFATPQSPRNPWTNEPFTWSQLLSITEQLRAWGRLGRHMTTFRHHRFDLPGWRLYHHSALTLAAIRTSLTRLDTPEAREMLEDFIHAKREELHLYTTPAIERAYRAALLRAPTHWFIETLKGVAFQHYEADHFGQNRHRHIHNRCDRVFLREDDFLEDIQRMGILSAL
jgi:hypothetical protein